MRTCGTLLAAAIVAATAGGLAHAQSSGAPPWPTKPVRLVIGLPPGSGSDLLARALALHLSVQWSQSVVVDNRPGANTIVATDLVAHAAPDGYTLLFGVGHSFTLIPHLYAKIPYDPIKDFAPITLLAEFGTVLVVNASLPVKNVTELIALARSQPGTITYASMGPGSSPHLMWEMINHKAGVRLLQIPYKGQPQMITALLANEVNATSASVFSVRPQVASGKLRALAYSGEKRSSAMPDLPTIGEAGYPQASIEVWYGLFAPAQTPRALIERIYRNVAALLENPQFREKELLSKGYEPAALGPEQAAARVRRDFEAGAELVRVSGARAE